MNAIKTLRSIREPLSLSQPALFMPIALHFRRGVWRDWRLLHAFQVVPLSRFGPAAGQPRVHHDDEDDARELSGVKGMIPVDARQICRGARGKKK